MKPQNEPRGLPRSYVSRLRLLRRLADAVGGKVTIICADAGYGKTTLVADFVASGMLRTEWYHLTPADRDVARLADGLEGCLQRLSANTAPTRGKGTRVARRGGSGLAVFSEVLLRQAAQAGPDTVLLVLDDYQNVDADAGANSLLSALIAESPACFRFIILSRSAPRLSLARLRARREVSILEEDELAFTLEETSRFLRSESALDLDDGAVALIHERTEGWAAGIAMVSQSLMYGRPEKVMDVLADPAASAWLVYDYLAEEVFDRQEPATQDFLVKTSILSTMTAASCDHLLETTRSLSTLLALEEKGLFTTSTSVSKHAFRYHQLFRETLRQKLYQRETRESIDRLHLKAADFHERAGEWDECVHHYLKAGAYEKAAQVVETIGEQYIFSGFFETVDHWLSMMPEGITSTRPWLIVLRARLSHLMMKHEEALRGLERALRLFQTSCDEGGQAWTAGDMGYVRFRMGQVQQSIRQFNSALALAGDTSMLKSEILVMKAQALRDAGMLDESEEACKASISELGAVGNDPRALRGFSRALRNLGITQMEKGDLESALRSVRESLAFCTSHGIGEYEETWVLAQLGAVLWARGEFDEAIQVLNRALSMSGRYIAFQQHIIGLWLGNSLRDFGRYGDAERAYEHSVRVGELERLFLAVVAGRTREAKARAVDLYRRHRLAESLIVRSTAEVVMAAVLRQCQDPDKALEHIREAVRLLKASGFRLRLASALLHQFRIEHDLCRFSEACDSLSEALQLATAGGYYHFFWWDPELIAFACQRSLAEGVNPDHTAELVARSLAGRSASILAPLLHNRRADVRRRAHSVLSSLPRSVSMRPQDEVLSDCHDIKLRSSVLQAIADGLISSDGVEILRKRRGLSWREIEILIEYYLRPAVTIGTAPAKLRQECARRLNISENTLRCHVNNIRGKLSLPAQVSGSRVLDWAEQEGLLPARNLPRVSTQDSA